MEYLKRFEHLIWSSDFNLLEMEKWQVNFLCSQLGTDLAEEIMFAIEQGTMMHALKHPLKTFDSI